MKKITNNVKNIKPVFLMAFFLILGIGTVNNAKACFCTAVPGAPTANAATGVTASGFSISWAVPTAQCAGIGGYTYQYSTSNTFTPNTSTNTTSTSATLSGLACGTTYYYRVAAYSGGGCATTNIGAWSNVITVTTSACSGASCTDGIKNGTETGIDCGGSCPNACHCANGIKDFDETQVDCGGTQCPVCVIPPATTATTGCSGVINTPVNLATCADVGTPNLDASGGVVTYNTAGATAPVPAPTCGTSTGGSWAHYDLKAGVTSMTFSYTSGGTGGAGNHNIWAAVYQGANTSAGGCPALTQVDCQQAGYFQMGGLYINNLIVQGLNPAQDVWVYMFDDGGKSFSLPYDVTGTGASPANNSCGGSISSPSGCNLGAIGDPWQGTLTSGPNNEGGTCTGGFNWGSNENTVWYTVTATATSGSVDVNNVICNSGVSGNAQFAVFSNCACPQIDQYANGTHPCFLGCATGTGTISLPTLTIGTTYYIAVDGFAGDICKWDFVTTGLILPVTWVDFKAKKNGKDVNLFWSSASESNANFYSIERTIDGETFEQVGTVKAHGNETTLSSYTFTDYNLSGGNYYRLKEYDFDGNFSYSKMVYVDMGAETKDPVAYVDPSSGKLVTVFDSKDSAPYSIKVYNALGQQLINQELEGGSETERSIDINNFNHGIYIVTLVNKMNNKNFTLKVIK